MHVATLPSPSSPLLFGMDWTPDNIKALRKRLGLNQQPFATALGFGSASRVSELENGATEPSDQVRRLLDYIDKYGVMPEEGNE